MGIFDDASRNPSPSPRPQGPPWDPPVDEFPRVAASALVLGRNDVVAVAVTAIWAYTTGFEFWVKAQFRHPGPAREDQPDDQSLHVGLQFADGTQVADVGGLPEPSGSAATGLILSPLSFGAGRRHLDRSYWVWPLPPPGPVVVACEWAAFNIGEEHAQVDAQLILDAAKHSVQLWPQDNG